MTFAHLRPSLAAILAMLAAASCSKSENDAATKHAEAEKEAAPCVASENGGVTAGHAWVRANPSGEGMSAAFFHLCNQGQEPKALTAVATPVAGAVELHTTSRNDEGVVSMQPIETLVVAPGAKAKLAPGGDHVMLMQLAGPIEAGASVPLTLTFDDGSTVSIEATAKDPAEAASHDHH